MEGKGVEDGESEWRSRGHRDRRKGEGGQVHGERTGIAGEEGLGSWVRERPNDWGAGAGDSLPLNPCNRVSAFLSP